MDFLLFRILPPLVLVLGLASGVHPAPVAATELLVMELREGLNEEWLPGGAEKGRGDGAADLEGRPEAPAEAPPSTAAKIESPR